MHLKKELTSRILYDKHDVTKSRIFYDFPRSLDIIAFLITKSVVIKVGIYNTKFDLMSIIIYIVWYYFSV